MKPENEIYCSHDKLFKKTFSDLSNARSFIEHYLPEEVLSLVDINTLEICKGSFIEKNLKEYYSDLLYKVSLGKDSAFIYLLFEHKSYPDGLIHLQLLKYMQGIWDLNIKQNKSKKLDPVIPLVMYHGKQRWNSPENFSDMFRLSHKSLKEYLPDFRYRLYDLSTYSDDDIKGTVISRVVMLIFKYIYKDDVDGRLPGIIKLLNDLAYQDTGLQYMETLIKYLVTNVEGMDIEKLKAIISTSLSKKEGEFVMTLAEKLLNEGIQKGKLEGIIEGTKKGRLEGRTEVTIESIRDILEVKFSQSKDIPVLMNLISNINSLDRLKMIKTVAKNAATISEIKEMVGD